MLNGIKRARLEKGISQKALAQMLGVSSVSVCKWEQGKTFPATKRLNLVAQALDTTVAALLNDMEGRAG